MNVIVVLLIVLAVGAIIIGGLHFFFSSGEEEPVVTKPTCDTCNGNDNRCEQECMMEAATKQVEYFDDEDRQAVRLLLRRGSGGVSRSALHHATRGGKGMEQKSDTQTSERAGPAERRIGDDDGGDMKPKG